MTSDVTIDSGAARGSGHVGLASAGLSLGVLLSVLDQTVVATALPEIAADGGGLSSISWVATAYLLASTATGTLYGRVSDRFGRRATFLAAVGLFTVASALCAVADSLGQLIAFRALQGIGAGGLFVLPSIALSELFPADQRGKVQGYLGAIFAIGSVGGPLVGGVLTDQLSWRWIFYINIPLGVLAILLTATTLRLPTGPHRTRLDLPGSALVVAAVIALMLAVEWGGREYDWDSATILGLLAAAVVLFAAFVWWERRSPSPVLPLRLMAGPVLRIAVPATVLLGALLYGSVFFLPTYFQHAHGMS
ncbi:MAG: MFS transporter, partial [Actinomadura rubrobrunea]|nr:MFS transporter [Actinomadura rubrobrunea]